MTAGESPARRRRHHRRRRLVFAAARRARVPARADPPHRAGRRERASLRSAVFLRIAADIGHGVGWLRWTTPIGWVEQLRPVTGARAGGAAPLRWRRRWCSRPRRSRSPGAATSARACIARGAAMRARGWRCSARRPQAAAASELPSLLGWLVGDRAVRVRARRVRAQRRGGDPQGLDPHLRPHHHDRRRATWRRCSPCSRWWSPCIAASRIGGLRDEESSGRLETLFALPVARRSWIGGRLALAAATTVAALARDGRAGVGGSGWSRAAACPSPTCSPRARTASRRRCSSSRSARSSSPGCRARARGRRSGWWRRVPVGARRGARERAVVAAHDLAVPPRDPGAARRGRPPRHRRHARVAALAPRPRSSASPAATCRPADRPAPGASSAAGERDQRRPRP